MSEIILSAYWSDAEVCETILNTGMTHRDSHHSELLRCVGLPQPDVHFIRSAQDIFVVSRPSHAYNVLHAFGVVHLPKEILKITFTSILIYFLDVHFSVILYNSLEYIFSRKTLCSHLSPCNLVCLFSACVTNAFFTLAVQLYLVCTQISSTA